MSKPYLISIILYAYFCGTLVAQKSVEPIINKADSLFADNDFIQARYYYELAQRFCERDISCKVLREFELENKLWKLDSVQAYSFNLPEYVSLLRKADSLQLKSPVMAMKTFDEASVLVPSLAYPFNKITYIINHSPKIQQQLLVLQAKKQREIYLDKLELALSSEKSGKKVEAYYQYKKIEQEYHNDETALKESERLEIEIGQKIARFEAYVAEANEYFINEKYSKSKTTFQKALEINSECKSCKSKLANLDYFIYVEKSKKREYENLKLEAKTNYETGKYETAYYQLVALNKKKPDDVEVNQWLQDVDKILQTELDDRIKTFNAKLLLERANEAFMNAEYSKALQYYIKLEVRYSDVIDYLSFVKARIEECSALENMNNAE
jgi:hypothetical protein